MSIDPSVLRRLLYLKISIEGSSSWAFREILDYIVELIEERLSLIVNEALETYGLEASIHPEKGCEVFPTEKKCSDIIVASIYEKDSNEPVAYAGYMLTRGENTLVFELFKVVDAETKTPI